MRYYEIKLTNPSGTNSAAAGQSNSITFTSYANGKTDLNALNVIFDIYNVAAGTPRGASMIQVWGIPLQTISNAFDFNGWNIDVSAGFKKGLPLANPNQAGPILTGSVLQSFGNWQGTDMNLNLVASAGYVAKFNGGGVWPEGQPLSTALQNYIPQAMPGFTFAPSTINPNLITSYDKPLAYDSFESFAKWLNRYTQSLIGGGYPGVSLRIDPGRKIVAFDNTLVTPAPNSAQDTKKTPNTKEVKIQFSELIGQPIWMDPVTISFKCPMRFDLNVGDFVIMPGGYYGIAPKNPASPWNYRNKADQSGEFQLIEVRHVGNYRQSDGNSWATVYQAQLMKG